MELLGGTLGSGDQVIFGAGKPLAVQLITIILPSSASSNTSLFGSVIVLGSINMRENHDITWDEASVIDGNDKWIQRCHLEGWYIRLMKSAMNRDEGFLPSDYDYLIRMVRNRLGSSNSRLLSNVYFLFIFYNI